MKWIRNYNYLIISKLYEIYLSYFEKFTFDLGIQLLFLPPYSPNLNLIERLWKMTKKKCLYAKYYESFQSFSEAIGSCLNSFSMKELDSCLTLKFQSFKNSQFYPVWSIDSGEITASNELLNNFVSKLQNHPTVIQYL